MRTQSSHNDLATMGKFAAASGRGIQHADYGSQSEATKRQKKHDMLLTFMANTKSQKRRPALVRPKLLSVLLSIFF